MAEAGTPRASAERQMRRTPEMVCERIAELAARTQADEVMVTTMIHGHEARVRSYELLAS